MGWLEELKVGDQVVVENTRTGRRAKPVDAITDDGIYVSGVKYWRKTGTTRAGYARLREAAPDMLKQARDEEERWELRYRFDQLAERASLPALERAVRELERDT